ncbi:MAG: hypothetical protein U9P10_09305 [Thermodesulfobacteriota bacterium]|nr:hypothetical protein [Thermodesulfobacteriota bacterium]
MPEMERIDMIYKIALHKSHEGGAVSVPGLRGELNPAAQHREYGLHAIAIGHGL